MKKRHMLVGLLVLMLVVAMTAVACGEDETTTTAAPSTETTAAPTETTAAPNTDTTAAGPASGEPIKIGFSNSLTGPSAAPGISVSQGANLQIEYVNANGGINGRPLELIEYDDKSEVPNAVANITKLIQEDKVFATIGPFAQYMQEAARGIAEQTQTPMVGNGPPSIEQIAGTQYQWSTMQSAGPVTQSDALMKVIATNGWKKILGIADVLGVHQETLDLLVEGAASGGYTFVKMPDTFGFDQTDFQPIINRIMEEYKKLEPDAVVLYVNPIALPALVKGITALGVTVPIQGSPAASHPAIFSMGPQTVEGIYVLDSGGISNAAALPDDWPLKEVQLEFIARFTEEYGNPPDHFAATGAGMVMVLTEALKQAGGADDKAKVQQVLINLTEVVIPEGLVTFTPQDTTSGVKGGMVQFQVKNGTFDFVGIVN